MSSVDMTVITDSSILSKPEFGFRRLGVGFIGAGMVGQVAHLANFAQIVGCRVIALAELRPELGRLAAAKFGVERLYPSHRAMLADPEVEAVVVVTRRPATGPIVLDALEAGRHVLSEKPMAHTVGQASRLAAASRQANRCYAVGFMKRHDAGYQRFKALYDGFVASKELGRVVFLRGYCLGGTFACNADGYVMTDEERSDGLASWPTAPDWLPGRMVADYAWFLNVFVHNINILRHLVGRMPDITMADLRHPNGRMIGFDWGCFSGVLEMAEIPFTDWREGIEVRFEKGCLTVEFPPPLLRNVPARVTLTRTRAEAGATEIAVPWSWAFRRQAEAFIADAMEGREPLASGSDAVEDMVLVETIWQQALAAGRAPVT